LKTVIGKNVADLSWKGLIIATAALLWHIGSAHAQEMEPRAYSPSPIGTNFLALGYAHTSGDVLMDPAVPITDVRAKIDTITPGYSRTFDLAGRMASIAALLPFVNGNVKGMVGTEPGEVTRTGIGDARLRLATNLIGGTALSREEFVANTPETTLGTSLSLVAPTGEYDSEHLINIGTNRWAFKPDIGFSKLFGDWFMDASAGVWLFTDNHNFYGGVRRSQDPLSSFQVHGGYTFRPGLWLAADATYYTGGQTSVAGVEKDDRQTNSRYGLTLSLPLSQSTAVKLACSKGLITRIGGDFTILSLTLQYRWFDN
jgi:hypothetical protein